jgi:hypothetical protein
LELWEALFWREKVAELPRVRKGWRPQMGARQAELGTRDDFHDEV